MMLKKQLNILGLARRAGSLISGDERVEQAIKREQVTLVIIAQEVSDKTRTRYERLCHERSIPLKQEGTQLELSQAIGQKRSILALTDRGFTKTFLSYDVKDEDSMIMD